MRGFLTFSWSLDDPVAVHTAQALTSAAVAEGWTQTETTGACWFGVRGPHAPPVYSPRPGTLVIGEVFAHPSAGSDRADDETDEAFAAWCCRHRWGRYVILFLDPKGAVTRVFRDPSGSLPVHGWRAGGVQIFTSEISDAVVAAAPPDVGFNWDRIRALVNHPFDLTGPPPLTGVMTVPPGCLGGLDGASVRLWSPEAFARTPTRCVQDARRDLRQTLDLCVAALAGRRAVGIEISGGLDSAIVGGALSALGRPVVLALNTRAAYAETDERRYAQAVAKMMGVDLTCRRREAVAYSAEMFEATAGDAWPSQNGRDLANDRLVAGACKDASLDTLLTGKGGDALFFQMPTPLAFADLWWDRPLRSLMSGQLPGVARWTRTSTWSLIRTARQSRRDACEDLPPGKRLQIDAIAGGVAYTSVCRRAEGVDMIHPLMAQPLVEWSLRTPVPHLVPNGRERGLARDVFADRLPAPVANRRGKGDYAAYFNQQAAQNLPFLRTYLLEGRLAAEHIIDRAVMEQQLDEDALRWQGGASEILAAVSVEAWVRRWEGRRRRA